MWRPNSLEKTLMLGKIEGRRRRGQQRMRWLDGINNLMNMNSSKLWEMVKHRETWHAAIHGVAKSRMWLSGRTTTVPISFHPTAPRPLQSEAKVPSQCLLQPHGPSFPDSLFCSWSLCPYHPHGLSVWSPVAQVSTLNTTSSEKPQRHHSLPTGASSLSSSVFFKHLIIICILCVFYFRIPNLDLNSVWAETPFSLSPE